MAEKTIEKYLKQEVEALGWQCWKFVSPGRNGVPDRICLGPEKEVEFVETKDTGETPKPLQRMVHKILARLGFNVWVIDTKKQVDNFCAYLKAKNLV